MSEKSTILLLRIASHDNLFPNKLRYLAEKTINA